MLRACDVNAFVALFLLQFLVTVVANNSILGAKMVCAITVLDMPEPPYFVVSSFEANQDSAFPGTSVGHVVAFDSDGETSLLDAFVDA